MTDGMLNERNRHVLIGVLMLIISFMFLYYMGDSLLSATKAYVEQMQQIELPLK